MPIVVSKQERTKLARSKFFVQKLVLSILRTPLGSIDVEMQVEHKSKIIVSIFHSFTHGKFIAVITVKCVYWPLVLILNFTGCSVRLLGLKE